MNIEAVVNPVAEMSPVTGLPPEDEAPVSFPIPTEGTDDSKSGEDAPVSFPIPTEVTDDSKGGEDAPVSFPIPTEETDDSKG